MTDTPSQNLTPPPLGTNTPSDPSTDSTSSLTPPPLTTKASTLSDPSTSQQPAEPTSRRQKELAPSATPLSETSPEASAAPAGSAESISDSLEETGSSAHSTEIEPAKEMEPEVEKLVGKIRSHKMKGPKETVIAATEEPKTTPRTVAQPVVVLPLSEKGMKTGRAKGPQFSIRWLFEWSTRQILRLKDFLVVYREE